MKRLVEVGKEYDSKYWGTMVVLSKLTDGGNTTSRYLVVFTRTGNKKSVRGREILDGKVCDTEASDNGINPVVPYPSPNRERGLIPVGTTYQSNLYGLVEVVEYNGNKDVVVKFLNTGNIQKVQKSALVVGMVQDVKLKEEVVATKAAEAQARSEAHKVRVEEWRKAAAEREKDEQKRKQAKDAARESAYKDKIRLLNARIERSKRERQQEEDTLKWLQGLVDISVQERFKNVKTRVNEDIHDGEKWILRWREKDGTFIQTRLGALHNAITQRGRVGGALQDMHSPTYRGVTVHPDFQDPQRFCEWVVRQKGWGYGYQLDKDLLIPGNREYGPDACCFIPSCLNIAIIQPKFGAKSWCQEGRGGHRLSMQVNNTTLRLKGFDSEDAVHASYKAIRERYVKALAEKFKDTISERAYEALMKWEVVIPETEQESIEV